MKNVIAYIVLLAALITVGITGCHSMGGSGHDSGGHYGHNH